MIVRLRPFAESDGQLVANWCNDPETTALMATGREWVTRQDAVGRWGGPHSFIVVAHAGSWWNDRLAGVIGLYDRERLSEKAELRIMLGLNEARGRGVGTQAVQHLVDYGFGALGLWRIYLGTAEANVAAIRCFSKCGFQREGVLRDDLTRDGKRFDNVRMALLRPDWEALQHGT